MKEMSIDEIVNLADSYSKNKIPWHHHFLTVKCNFNHGKNCPYKLSYFYNNVISFKNVKRYSDDNL